jgi:hypothetical protein
MTAPDHTAKPAEKFPCADGGIHTWHYTPKHGSWLDLAESELSVLSSQCLDRRIGDIESLRGEVAAWGADRNKNQAKADWQFTTDDARVKLKALYPIFPAQNG